MSSRFRRATCICTVMCGSAVACTITARRKGPKRACNSPNACSSDAVLSPRTAYSPGPYTSRWVTHNFVSGPRPVARSVGSTASHTSCDAGALGSVACRHSSCRRVSSATNAARGAPPPMVNSTARAAKGSGGESNATARCVARCGAVSAKLPRTLSSSALAISRVRLPASHCASTSNQIRSSSATPASSSVGPTDAPANLSSD